MTTDTELVNQIVDDVAKALRILEQDKIYKYSDPDLPNVLNLLHDVGFGLCILLGRWGNDRVRIAER